MVVLPNIRMFEHPALKECCNLLLLFLCEWIENVGTAWRSLALGRGGMLKKKRG